MRTIASILGHSISATDGDIGAARDMLFDDHSWEIRYLVVDTSKWLPGRRVLIVPSELKKPDWKNKKFPVELSREHIKSSPPLATDKPVSHQYESKLHRHFSWRPYWETRTPGEHAHRMRPDARNYIPPQPAEHTDKMPPLDGDPHLRSVKEIMGYQLKASTGEYGQIVDFVIDDESWTVGYLTVEFRRLMPGKKVLLPHALITSIDWDNKSISVDASIEMISNAPPFDNDKPVKPEYEEVLRDHYDLSPQK